MTKEKLSKEFMTALVNYHNPETIFKLAKTEFEKAVAIEFFLVKQRMDKQDNDVKWLKWLCRAVFGVGSIGVVIQVIPMLFGV